MKKQLTAVLLVFALLLTMAGCSAAGLERKIDAAEDRVEHRLDVAEDALENAVHPTTAPRKAEPRKEVSAAAPQPRISPEEAEKAALDHVGLSADRVQRLRTGLERDDGITQYDVEFLEGDWEYEFEIDADTGKILSFDKDHKYD